MYIYVSKWENNGILTEKCTDYNCKIFEKVPAVAEIIFSQQYFLLYVKSSLNRSYEKYRYDNS